MNVEKMTVIMSAVIHGDTETLTDSQTFEGETKGELLKCYMAFLRELADDAEGVLNGE